MVPFYAQFQGLIAQEVHQISVASSTACVCVKSLRNMLKDHLDEELEITFVVLLVEKYLRRYSC